MKHLYLTSLYLFFLLVGYTACTPESEAWENISTGNQVPASFTMCSDIPTTPLTRSASNDIMLETDNPTVMVSMEEMPWVDEPQSRTAWGTNDNKVTWTTSDRIGIYMRSAAGGNSYYDKQNVQYSVVSGGSASASLAPVSTPIYFPDQVTNTKFFAYYPYSTSAGSTITAVPYTLPVNQTPPTGLSLADVMCANTPTAYGASPNVGLHFNHKMVLLTFRVKTSLLPATLTKIALTGQSVTHTGTLDLTTGTVTPNTVTTFAPYVSTSQGIGPTTYANVDVIINPCTISSNIGGSNLNVTLSFSGLLDHSTSLISSGTFVAGTRYVYTLSVVLSL